MDLKSIIEQKLDSDRSRCLWEASKAIVNDCIQHLSLITAQMPNYDIHDQEHSQKVLENIECFLGDNAEKLSVYELILIYLSCYLHDSAMALPSWEYDMLCAVEGCEECYDNSARISIKNDFNAAQSLSQLKAFIGQNREKIYHTFEQVSGFVFAPNNEDQLQLDIAKRARSYEEFRNGFADRLSVRKGDITEYLELSKLIRYEYIRKTHHIRAADYISNLRKKLSHEIGESATVKVLADLSNVCRAHGEPIEFVWELDQNSNVDQIGSANLRFVAIMLRLGDATHFSSDRAPVSLFSEKGITNSESRTHWEAKFADTKYSIAALQDGKTTIFFSAFCTEPSIYYFLHDYINWIDIELGYYFSFLHDLEFHKQDTVEYDLQLNNKVDRTGIIPDTEKFVPDNDARFSMDQSKILSLLMGTQLYKDKYLCLRELYQNSLDACKCMKAQDESTGVQSKYKIIFGLETTDEGKKYIYCLDNGTGMTKEIVKNYFLRIGNSYYKSQEFIGKNVGWKDKVNPTSQFGIGVLSCFMIGNSIEVTTKHYDAQTDAFSFCAEANNEHFYYIPVNPLDEERIGFHGTLIKIFLSEEEVQSINNFVPDDAAFIIYASGNQYRGDKNYLDEASTLLEDSIFYKVNKQIGVFYPSIDVFIHTDDNDIPLIQRNQLFDYKALMIDEKKVEDLWATYHFWKVAENPYKDVIKYHDYIRNIPIYVTENGVELETFISLPKKGMPIKSKYMFSFEDYIWKNSSLQVLVDGIVVSDSNHRLDLGNCLGVSLLQSGKIIINFTGKLRPILSIDRNTVVSYPEEVFSVLNILISKLIEKIIALFFSYLEEEDIGVDSDDFHFALDWLLFMYEDFSAEILKQISETEYGETSIRGIDEENCDMPISIKEAICGQELQLRNVNFKSYSFVLNEIFAGKMVSASRIDINNADVEIWSAGFTTPSSIFGINHHYFSCHYVLKADTWIGTYESFDIATNIWPIVPERLFNKISLEYGRELSFDGSRIRFLSDAGNGLNGIATLEARLINPKFGISTYHRDGFLKEKSLVGRCENIQNNYWLFEINHNRDTVRSENKDYALFAYISPSSLSDEDEVKLQDYVGTDDIYVQGAREGWSILFLGYDKVYYILPGVRKKSELVALIPPSIRDRKDSVMYYNLDETPLFT